FVVRAGEVYTLIEDEKTKMKLFRYVSEIVGNYAFNKLLPFFCDEDGLLEIKKGEEALTWMDAKIYNKPVTPRYGKPVEINSLWYNSLKVFELMSKDLSRKTFKLKYMKFTIKDIRSLIKKVRSSAKKFVTEGHIADRIEEDIPVDEFRPNTVIAMSLPNDLWDKKVMENTFDIVKNELLTPYGLRTLTPRNSSFKKKYIGNQTQLDMAYHQGTVWAWLLGPFAETYYKLNKKRMKKSEIKNTIELFIAKFKEGILKGHISSVAEIWDGDKPHFPKGCPAQAWSVSGIMSAENIFKKTGAKK
ncbi:MAG: amylo-alpha-1,6-glucosidase, partial [Candidatus Delongbacteria bacterium]